MNKYQNIVELLEKALPDSYFYGERDPLGRYDRLPEKLKDASLLMYSVMKEQHLSDKDIAIKIFKSIIFNIEPWWMPLEYVGKYGMFCTADLSSERIKKLDNLTEKMR